MNKQKHWCKNLKLQKLKDYFVQSFSNKWTYVYVLSFILLYVILVIAIIFAARRVFIDAFGISGAILFSITFLVILVKIGLFSPFIHQRYKKRIERLQYKKNQLVKISNLSRREYEMKKINLLLEDAKQLNSKKPEHKINNLIWYLILAIEIICLIITICVIV